MGLLSSKYVSKCMFHMQFKVFKRISEKLENDSIDFMNVRQGIDILILFRPTKRVLPTTIWPKIYQMKAEDLIFKLIAELFKNK